MGITVIGGTSGTLQDVDTTPKAARVILYDATGAVISIVSNSVAHDGAASAVNPVLEGGYANAAAPADVNADLDAVRAWYLRNGAQVTQPTFGGILGVAGNGIAGTGTQRVTIASDNTPWTSQGGKTNNNAAPGATNIGALTVLANAAAPSWTEGNEVLLSTDLAGTLRSEVTKIAGTATSTAAAGVQKVGVVGNAGAAFDSATAAVVPANAIHAGGKTATANPTNATGGNMTSVMVDKAGRVVVSPGHIRELVATQTTTISASTAETTIVTAGAAGVFNDISCFILSTTNSAAGTVTIKDATAGTTRFVFNYPNAAVAPESPRVLNFIIPISQAVAANNWTATCSANAGSYTIAAVFIKNL